MEPVRNYFVAYIFVSNKKYGHVQLVVIPYPQDSTTIPIPTKRDHWTRISIGTIRTARWFDANFSESFATKLLVQVESLKDQTTLSWRKDDLGNDRRDAECLLGRRTTRKYANDPPAPPATTSSSPTPALKKRKDSNEDMSKEVVRLTTSLRNLKESEYMSSPWSFN